MPPIASVRRHKAQHERAGRATISPQSCPLYVAHVLPEPWNSREVSDLLGPQAGGAPPRPLRQSDILGLEGLAPAAQEVGKPNSIHILIVVAY